MRRVVMKVWNETWELDYVEVMGVEAGGRGSLIVGVWRDDIGPAILCPGFRRSCLQLEFFNQTGLSRRLPQDLAGYLEGIALWMLFSVFFSCCGWGGIIYFWILGSSAPVRIETNIRTEISKLSFNENNFWRIEW